MPRDLEPDSPYSGFIAQALMMSRHAIVKLTNVHFADETMIDPVVGFDPAPHGVWSPVLEGPPCLICVIAPNASGS